MQDTPVQIEEVALEEGLESSTSLLFSDDDAGTPSRKLGWRRHAFTTVAVAAPFMLAGAVWRSVGSNHIQTSAEIKSSPKLTQEFLLLESPKDGQCGPVEEGIDYGRNSSWGGLVGHVDTPFSCCDKCYSGESCVSWSWSNDSKECWLGRHAPTEKKRLAGFVSGIVPYGARQHSMETSADKLEENKTDNSSHHQNATVATKKAKAEKTYVKVLTYNLFWWNLFMQRRGNGGSASKLIRDAGRDDAFDVMGFQECVDPIRVLGEAGLADEYATVRFGRPTMTNNLCIAYRNSSWSLLAKGQATVGEDTKTSYYGQRYVQWTRLRNQQTNQSVFFMTHQGPLPINTGGTIGGQAVAEHVLQQIKTHSDAEDALVLVGDFNADAKSPTIQTLERDLKRVFTGTVGGGIDHIFSSKDNLIMKHTNNLGAGGSDHDALSVTFELKRLQTGEDGDDDVLHGKHQVERERTMVPMLK